MNTIRNYFSNLYARFFTVTISKALADLDKAEAKLRKAAAAHADKADAHLFAAEQHKAAYEAQADASARADRVATKLAELTA